MANPWFRLYAEFEDDPKVRMMPDAMQTRLVYLMCEKCKGVTLTERHRTFQWRCSDAELAETKRVFLESGFIDEDWNLINWNKRQFLSDSSTDRTRRYRERHRTSQERHSDASVTASDTETDTEQIQKQTHKTPKLSPDSVDVRIISETVGIFGMREQANMMRLVSQYTTKSQKPIEEAITHMEKRWKEYQAAVPLLEWSYGSSYKFFMSGNWDIPQNWPYKAAEGEGNGANHKSPAKERVDNNRRAIAEALARRGVKGPWDTPREHGETIPEPGPVDDAGRVHAGLREVGAEVLPPRGRRRDSHAAD